MPTNFNQTAETTFTLRFDTMECCPKMEGSFERVPANRIKCALSVAKSAFRSVDVIDENTGEVMYNQTISPAWFNPLCSYGDAIDTIHEICYGD
jgi:hypothetical protein